MIAYDCYGCLSDNNSSMYPPLPKLENINDLENLSVTVDDFISNGIRDILYKRIDNFIPSGGGENVLDIKLERSSLVDIIFDFSNDNIKEKEMFIYKIDYAYQRAVGKILLSNFTASTFEHRHIWQESVAGGGTRDDNDEVRYFPKSFLIPKNHSTEVQLDIRNIDIRSHKGAYWQFNFSFKFEAKRGRKIIRIKRRPSGVFLGPNKTNFREILNGSKRIRNWGKLNNSQEYEEGDSWPEDENPCLAGYRVPTKDELQSMIDNDLLEFRINEFVSSLQLKGLDKTYVSDANYYSGLTLWSSTSYDVNRAYAIYVGPWDPTEIKIFTIRKNSHGAAFVYCIKKLPNE